MKEFLDELLDILIKQHALVQGVPVPLTDSTALPIVPHLEELKSKIEQPEFWSEYHFIENNEQKAEPE